MGNYELVLGATESSEQFVTQEKCSSGILSLVLPS